MFTGGIKYKKIGFISSALLTVILIFICPNAYSQTNLGADTGEYKIIYDSTYIWPDGYGGFEYFRKFVSEALLAENGRAALSKTATPILDSGDEIEIKAYTILSSNDTIAVPEDNIIMQPLDGKRKRFFISFNQLDAGAVLHFEWKLKSTIANLSGKRFIGRTIPVKNSKIVITLPKNWIFRFGVSPEIDFISETNEFEDNFNKNKVNYVWLAENVPPLTKEEFSPYFERAIPALYFSLYQDQGWEDGVVPEISWDFISSVYLQVFENFERNKSKLEPIVKLFNNSEVEIRNSAGLAFDWVRSYFQCTSSDIGLSESMNVAFDRGKGNQSEAAAIYYHLLKELNIPAGIYLAASRNIGEPLPDFPALFWFDRLLVACFIDNDTLWADPFYPVSELGILPFEDQGVSILRIDRQENGLSSTPDIDYHVNGKAIHLTLVIDSTGALTGEATEIYSGAMIPEISTYLITLDENERKSRWEGKLARTFPRLKLKGFRIVPPDTSGQEYRIAYTFKTEPIIRPFVNRAYFPMDMMGRWEDLPDLPDTEREFPIILKRPRFEFERITIKLSPVFDIEQLPKNYSLNSHIGEIYSVAMKGDNAITITRGFGLKRSYLPASAYKSLRKFFNAAKSEADNQIVLRRIG